MNETMPTGMVCVSTFSDSTSGMKNSFHIHTPFRMQTEARPGRSSGRTILRKIRHSPAPSTRAASPSSRGITAINGVNISTPSGRPSAV